MTVSRKNKYGRRAGNKTHRPASRNRRVIVNAKLKSVTKALDERPTAARVSKEQWVITCVARIVGSKAGNGFVQADDVASDIILALLDAGGFSWEEEEIEVFCRRKAAYMVLQYVSRRERNECEFSMQDGTLVEIIDMRAICREMQDVAFDAKAAVELLPLLPALHRQALEILCDGGTPIDIAEELAVPPWEAITLIKQARDYIDRVGPLDWAA